MGKLTILALRVVLAILLIGTLFLQVVMIAVVGVDLDNSGGELAAVRVPVCVILVLGLGTIQATLVCVWRLLTMVRRGTVFSSAAFRYVDVVIGAATAAALLTGVLAVVLAPGEAVPPGMVGLICGLAVVAAGIALVVLVMRTLLAQAVARDTEAQHLQAELDEVI